MIVAPPIIALIKKAKAKQTILVYVEQHKDKVGTPTMGGLIFLISAALSCLFFWQGEKRLALIALIVTFAYGLVGGLDDLIKVVFKRNLGLRPYQKIISQAAIAALATYFSYSSEYIGTAISLPFLHTTVELSYWYLPLCFIAYIATTNCVNLTDGLDGLAGSTSALYLAAFFTIAVFTFSSASDLGRTLYAEEVKNLAVFIAALIGGLIAFLWFNSHKAKIFMGDTGSLALGGACAAVAIFMKNPLSILLVGISFVLSGISVIIQVVVYKIKKRRVFLMAPLHHHLEMRGNSEAKIVSMYSIVTAIAGVVAVLGVLQ
ncbi:MAG: phospho-N-acetylmuramoyl-pentapeptide-transferase [Clostridia bacterium]|nr:phospho-N-acetylmuramoyl-pentapeptide-transferase [Clostridia bacterium]